MMSLWRTLALVLAVLFAPAWCAIALMLIVIVFARAYIPAMLAGALFDLLYYGGSLSPHVPFVIMIPLAVHCFWVSLFAIFVRSRMRESGI